MLRNPFHEALHGGVGLSIVSFLTGAHSVADGRLVVFPPIFNRLRRLVGLDPGGDVRAERMISCARC